MFCQKKACNAKWLEKKVFSKRNRFHIIYRLKVSVNELLICAQVEVFFDTERKM